ncbi:MAG: hypothetical protein HUK19_07525 [Fibrobacter sp.]|nr:hypothetical protein [Fibrobacter sp.]
MTFVVSVFLSLVGCSADYEIVDDYYEQTMSKYMENRTLYGDIVLPKPFSLDSIKLFELDSNRNKFLEVENVEIDSNWQGIHYYVPRRNYSTPLVQMDFFGTWMAQDSIKSSLKLEKRMSLITSVYDNDFHFADYLIIPRIEILMKEGYPFDVAQKKAQIDFSSFLGLYYDEDFLFNLFQFNDSSSNFVENIENFRHDFAKGSWLDYRDYIKVADYLTREWLLLTDSLDYYHNGSEDVRYYCRTQMFFYGVPIDTRSGQTFIIDDSTSSFYKDSLVCAGYGINKHRILRPFTDLERQIGVCTYDSLKFANKDTTVVEFEGETYRCTHEWKDGPSSSEYIDGWRKVK